MHVLSALTMAEMMWQRSLAVIHLQSAFRWTMSALATGSECYQLLMETVMRRKGRSLRQFMSIK